MLKIVPINIWDDYYEDGYIPEGEKQETFIYVEDNAIPQVKRKECLEKLLDYVNNNLKLEGIKLWMAFYNSRNEYPNSDSAYHFERWEIRANNLTHKRRELLVRELSESNLSIDGIPFKIYSES